jgi:hypothetical protein
MLREEHYFACLRPTLRLTAGDLAQEKNSRQTLTLLRVGAEPDPTRRSPTSKEQPGVAFRNLGLYGGCMTAEARCTWFADWNSA